MFKAENGINGRCKYDCGLFTDCLGNIERCTVGNTENFSAHKRADKSVEIESKKAPIIASWEKTTQNHEWTPIGTIYSSCKDDGNVFIIKLTKSGVQSQFIKTYAE